MLAPADLTAFEDRIREHWRAGRLPCLLHLCGGNEEDLCRVFADWKPGDWVCSTHRNHFHALLAGIPADELEQSILDGRSMFTFSAKHRFLSSSILAGLAGVAVGIAWAMKERGEDSRVLCFAGDGSEEEGHLYEAALFVEAHRLPVKFVIECNDRQVDTSIDERRPRVTMTLDNMFYCVRRYQYTPTYPHAGDGSPAGSIRFQPEVIERMRQTWP